MTAQVTVVGNLTADPELKITKTGSSVLKVGVATNRRWKNKQDEWEEVVSFFDVNAWGELAENSAASLSKGARVLISGRLEQQTWEKEGQKQSKVVLVADDIGVSLRKAQVAGINKTGQQAQQQKVASQGKQTSWGDESF